MSYHPWTPTPHQVGHKPVGGDPALGGAASSVLDKRSDKENASSVWNISSLFVKIEI